MKDWKYAKINSAKVLYLVFSKTNGHFNKNKHLILVPINASKKEKQNGELWIKYRDLTSSIAKNPERITLNKTIDIPSMIIVVRKDFHENSKYYPQVF